MDRSLIEQPQARPNCARVSRSKLRRGRGDTTGEAEVFFDLLMQTLPEGMRSLNAAARSRNRPPTPPSIADVSQRVAAPISALSLSPTAWASASSAASRGKLVTRRPNRGRSAKAVHRDVCVPHTLQQLWQCHREKGSPFFAPGKTKSLCRISAISVRIAMARAEEEHDVPAGLHAVRGYRPHALAGGRSRPRPH